MNMNSNRHIYIYIFIFGFVLNEDFVFCFSRKALYLSADIATVVCECRNDNLLLEHLDALRYYPIEESICYLDPTAFYRYWDIFLNPCASSDGRLTTACQCDSW